MSILTQIISGWPGLFYALVSWMLFHFISICNRDILKPTIYCLFTRQRKSNYFKSLPIIQKEQVLNIPSGSRLSSLILSSVILPENKSNRSEFYALFSGSVKKLGLLFGIFIVVSFVSVSNVLAATRTASVSGNWSDPATWGGATVPVAGDEVNINSGITVTIDMDVPALKSLAISGTLQYEVSTARTMTVAEIVTINSGGIFKSAPSSSNSTITTHSLVVGGSIINNGTINFSATAGAGGTTANASGAGITFTGASNATFDFSTATLTNLRQTNGLVLNKGTTASSVLTFIPGGTFQVLSGNTDGFLTINNGTFKIIGSNAFSNPVFELLSYVIPGSGGFELSNPNAVIVGQNGSVDNNGILRISAGIYNIGSALGNSSVTNNGGTFELSGGEMNVAGRFLLSNAQGLLTGGNLNLSTIGHASATQATFQCSLTSDLTISGSATVTFIKPNTNATPFNDIEILNGSGSKSIAGGTFLLGNASTPAGSIFRINSDIPLNNLTIGTNAVAILTDDLTINQNLLVNGELQVNGNDLVLRKFLPDVELNFTEGIFNSGSAINVVSTNGIHPKNKNSTNYLNHYWTITTSNITNPKVDVTLTYSETDVVGSDSKIVTGVYKPDSKWYKYSPALTALNNLPATGIDNTSFSITGISGDPPTVTITPSPATICAGASSNLTATPVGDSPFSYLWAPATGLSSSTIANPVATPAATTNYTVTVTDGNGFTANASQIITVNPVNTVSVGSSAPTVCLNSALTNITHTTTGATGIGAASGLPAGVSAVWATNAITISGTPTASGTFNYTIPLTGGCGSVNATGTITVNPVNTVSVGSSAPTVCMNSALTNITHTTTGATGIGAASGLPAGVSAVWAANTITISGTPTANGTFNYTIPLTGGCGLVNATGTITVNPLPTVTAPADQTYCMGATTLPIPLVGAPSGVIFDISGGAAIGLTNKIGVTQIPSYAATTGTATITITPRANGCTGSPVTFTVTVDPRPNIHLSASARTICSGGNTNISITSSTASATFSWVVQSMTGTITGASGGTGNLLDQTLYNNTATTGTVVYQITASAGGCEGATINLTVTVHPEVSATIAGTTTVCQNDTPAPVVTYTASGGTAPYTFTYSINSGANQQVTVASGNTATVTAPTGVSGTFVYNLVSVSGSAGCAYPQTGTATVTVNPLPTLTSSLTPPGICSNTPFNYAHVSSLLNTDFHWVREVVPGISNPREEGDNIYPDETLINTTTSPIEVVYKYTLTANGCKNTQYVKVMVTQSPVLTSTLTPAPICSGTLFSYIPTSNINPGTTFSWTRAADSYGNSAKSGTGNPNEILYNNSTSTISVIYHYSLSSNGCTNPTDFQVVVPVVPAPVVWANASPTPVCSGKPVALSSGSNIVSGLPTTILTQDFNGAVSGWTANSAGFGTWQILNSLNIGGGNQITNGGSKFYVSDMRSANTTSTLTRSVFINTQGYQTVTMTFDHYYRDNNSSIATVRWSSDGISWPNSNILATYDSNRGTRNNFTNETVNIPVGQPKVYIRFSYQANNDYYWAIDDVSITGVPQATATILWTSNKSSWTSTQKDVSVSPTETTIYTATYTDQATGCSGSASTTVTVYPTPDATITANYCEAKPKIRLRTGSFATYSWSPLPLGETNGKQYIDIDIAGIYTVNVTDANGCTSSASINVSNEYVTNGSFNDGNTGFTTDYWSSNNLSTGNRTVGGINYTGGEGYYAVGPDARAYHTNFWGWDHTVHNGSAPNNFLIVNGVGNTLRVWEEGPITVTPNTKYYFSAWALNLNADGSNNTYWPKLQFFINGQPFGSIAQLGKGIVGNSQNNPWLDKDRFYGTWDSGSSTSIILTIRQLNTEAGGNDFGIDDISFGILDPSPATINPTSNNDVCSGDVINLYANVTGGKEPIVYTWTYPNGMISHDKDPVIPVADNTYDGTYTLKVTDWYGCDIPSKTTTVKVYPVPTVNAGPDQLLGCSATSIFDLNGSRGGAATSSTWTTSGSGTFDDATSLTAKYTISAADIAAGSVTLTLTTDDPTGPCLAASDDMILTIHRSPELSVAVAAPLCAGFSDGSATATVTNGTAPFTYLWSNGQTTAKAVNLANGTYTVTVTDANGCTDTETIAVIEPTPLVVSPASFTPPTCYGGNDGTATVNAEGGTEPYIYKWDAAAGNQTTKTAVGLKVGIYLFTVTDANGCNITSDFVLVTQPDPPSLLCPSDPAPVTVTGGATTAPVILTAPIYDPVCQILSWTMSGATIVSTPVLGVVPSPYTFNVGTTTVEYSAVNVAGEELTCTFDVVVIGGADLSIAKTANPSPVNTGDPLIYTITVSNDGPAEAVNVSIADVVAALPSPEFTTDLANGPWNPWVTPYLPGNLASGSSITIYIRGTVPLTQCGNIANTATVSSDTNDADLSNNSATITTPVTDNQPPTFTTVNTLSYCVENIQNAVYNNTPTVGIVPEYDDLTTPRPEYYRLTAASKLLDLDPVINNFNDNCCPNNSLIIHWEILFAPTPNPASVAHELITKPPILGQTGQPSAYGDILFPGDGVTFTDIIHQINYWLEDCNGNPASNPVIHSVNIIIKPRPNIIKMN